MSAFGTRPRGERDMTHEHIGTALQLYSTVKQEGILELSLADMPIPEPQDDEVVVRVEAAPINPSDLGLLFGPADMSTVQVTGTADHPVVTARIPPRLMPAVVGRVDQSMPVGNEGAGVVVKAGASTLAQALLGKTVALLGGAMYAQFRAISAAQCLVLPEGTTPAEGASCFVNPLTVLGMVGTMRLEGHTALVHTAAASNLGQMLNKVCLQENIGRSIYHSLSKVEDSGHGHEKVSKRCASLQAIGSEMVRRWSASRPVF